MFSFGKGTGDATKMSLEAFVSLLQKVLPVELKLFNMECLKNISITEKVLIQFTMNIVL